MSSADAGLDIRLSIAPSRGLLVWIFSVAALSASLLLLYCPLWIGVIASAAVVAVAIFLSRRDALLAAADSIVAMRFSKFNLEFQCRDGEWHEVQEAAASGFSFVSRWLCVVAVRAVNSPRRRFIVLLPDSLPDDAARKVRVWLRWRKTPHSAAHS